MGVHSRPLNHFILSINSTSLSFSGHSLLGQHPHYYSFTNSNQIKGDDVITPILFLVLLPMKGNRKKAFVAIEYPVDESGLDRAEGTYLMQEDNIGNFGHKLIRWPHGMEQKNHLIQSTWFTININHIFKLIDFLLF